MFVERFGNYLSDKVFLKVPSGSKWLVELVKNGNATYFGNGWQQFVDYYSISHGSFLVFGFESFETCCLQVIIFDKSASEIDYPLSDKQLHEKVGHLNSGSHAPNRKQANCSGNSQANRCNMEKSAKRKQSSNPSFSVTMHPTYVNGKFRVTIPASAARYFRKQSGNILLNSIDGKCWSVEYANYKTNRGIKFAMISRGWRKFVRDNNLMVGDVCVFELTNEKANELRVVISRKDANAKVVPSTGSDLSKLNASNPYFKVKLTQNHFNKRCLCIPTDFMDKCENRSKEKAILLVENRVWPVKLLCYPSHSVFTLSRGFSTFLSDNNLRVGDACGFELISNEPFWLKVFIFRDNR